MALIRKTLFTFRKKCLLFVFAGKAVITSDGFTIIECLQADHPVAQLVFEALKRCHAFTQDGCKLFLLYLDNILKGLNSTVSGGKFCPNGVNVGGSRSALERQGIVYAGVSVRKLSMIILQDFQTQMFAYSYSLYDRVLEQYSLKQLLFSVCKTALMPHYSPKVCEFLSSKLLAAFPTYGNHTECYMFFQTLSAFINAYYSVIIKIPDRPYHQCSVVEPLLIKGKFAVKSEDFGSEPIKAVLLRNGMDCFQTGEDAREVLSIKSSGQVTNILLHRRKTVQKFAEACQRQDVNLLLCTENVPGFALEILQRQKISVVAYVLSEEIDLLEMITGKVPLVSINDEILAHKVLPLSRVTELIIGGQKYLQLPVDSCQWKHLVLCAPTIGLCDQLAVMCHKALNAVKLCFEPCVTTNSQTLASSNRTSVSFSPTSIEKKVTDLCNNACKCTFGTDSEQPVVQTDSKLAHKMSIVPGGGSFEMHMSSLLKDYRTKQGDSNLAAMCSILEDTFKNVVNVLYRNTNITDKKRRFTEAMMVLEEKANSGSEVWGLDRRGIPRNLVERGVFEPLVCKMHILQCVLNLVDQLLRVDKVLSIRKLLADTDSEEDDS